MEPKTEASPSKRLRRFTGRYCCVVGCHNLERRDKSVKFYRFPGKWYQREQRRAWTEAVRRVNPDGTPWEPRDNTRICSDHFVGKKKSNAVDHPAYIPTIFPPVYDRNVRDPEKTHRLDFSPNKQHHSLGCYEETAIGHRPCGHGNGCSKNKCIYRNLFTMACKSRNDTEDPPLINSLGRRSLQIAWEVPPVALVESACQTYSSSEGMLTILLSATDGTQASTQVCHTVQSDEVNDTDNG
nr:uncharacterized protein LOC119184971 [Rhipicephalus microplus]